MDVDDREPGRYNEPAEHPPWPTDDEHLWGEWYAHRPRQGAKPPTQHRKCEHPRCTAYEVRTVTG